ncbi:MAG TPA: HAMP domain-containing sensor histidine kinase [Candidatus Saccharimonadales bacterium]|jgi:signal transduction histidine kinase|nr:HAMP domain-containing sensor histidine kinase [Candidatus Saccharimonadales bacterium]
MSDPHKTNDSQEIIHQDVQIFELKKDLLYYRDITETVREPFIILNKYLYVITANKAFYSKFKVRKKDTRGKHLFELGDGQWDVPELRNLLEHILPIKNGVLTNYELTLNFPSLGRKTMLLNAKRVDSKQLILLAMEDISSAKILQLNSHRMTANLIKQRDQLQQLNEAKDEFISLASHQLRTPATAVKQYIDMLRLGYAGKMSKGQKQMLGVAYTNNERQLEIIEDLLRIAKVDSGKLILHKSSYDMVKQINLVIKELAILFKGRGQSIVFNKPAKKVVVYSDENLILMVLENILDNASKYSQQGAQITIDINQNDVLTSVSIKDNGVGICQADVHNLFKKFIRIDNAMSNVVKGTGLGLYWAQKVLFLHGGSIEVSSKINKGSTFLVNIPRNMLV